MTGRQTVTNPWPDDLSTLIRSPGCTISLRTEPGTDGKLSNDIKQGVYIQNRTDPPGEQSDGFNVTGISQPNPTSLQMTPNQPYYFKNSEAPLGASPADRVDWGRNRASRNNIAGFNGVCDGFTYITIAMIVAQNSTVPQSMPVEQFSQGSSGVSHTYTVLNRDPSSTPGDFATWGSGWFIVDQWWALQTGNNAVITSGSQEFDTWKANIAKKYKTVPKLQGTWAARTGNYKINYGTAKYDKAIAS
jgi:hypothetical protein